MVEIVGSHNTQDEGAIEQKMNVLEFAENPGDKQASIDDLILKQRFLDNSVSMGVGEENRSVLPDNFRERHDLEQYFFTKEMIDKYITALTMRFEDKQNLESKLCLICAPSLATAFYERHDIAVHCLDIDTRFSNLPKFIYFDL